MGGGGTGAFVHACVHTLRRASTATVFCHVVRPSRASSPRRARVASGIATLCTRRDAHPPRRASAAACIALTCIRRNLPPPSSSPFPLSRTSKGKLYSERHGASTVGGDMASVGAGGAAGARLEEGDGDDAMDEGAAGEAASGGAGVASGGAGLSLDKRSAGRGGGGTSVAGGEGVVPGSEGARLAEFLGQGWVAAGQYVALTLSAVPKEAVANAAPPGGCAPRPCLRRGRLRFTPPPSPLHRVCRRAAGCVLPAAAREQDDCHDVQPHPTGRRPHRLRGAHQGQGAWQRERERGLGRAKFVR
jgi:hypothetical protein